jgi:tetratricopeptide (TPR) repeat protein
MLLTGGLLVCATASSAELEQIHALADRGRTEEALRRLDGLRLGESQQLEGRLLRGVLLAELGRNSEAERAFRLLSRDSPDRPEPVHNLAVLQAMGGRPATAIIALEDLLDRYPGYDQAARNLERIRRGAAGGSFDPLSGGSARVALALTSRLGAFPSPAPAEPPTPALAPPTSAVTPPEMASPSLPEGVTEPAAAVLEPAPEPAPEATHPAHERQPAESQPPEPQPVELEPMPVAVADPEVTAVEPEAPVADTPPTEGDLGAEIESVVAAWAEAWSQQRLREYLAFYASDFQATAFASREAWESTRRQRLATPSFIEVEIDLDSMTVREVGPSEVAATFVQSYRSDRHSDTVEKTLVFVRQDGAWRIRNETSQ